MTGALTFTAVALMLALSICAFVGLDVMMRPAHYIREGDPRGLSVPLNSISRVLLPGIRKEPAYRLIGLAVASLTFGLALLVCLSAFNIFWTE